MNSKLKDGYGNPLQEGGLYVYLHHPPLPGSGTRIDPVKDGAFPLQLGFDGNGNPLAIYFEDNRLVQRPLENNFPGSTMQERTRHFFPIENPEEYKSRLTKRINSCQCFLNFLKMSKLEREAQCDTTLPLARDIPPPQSSFDYGLDP